MGLLEWNNKNKLKQLNLVGCDPWNVVHNGKNRNLWIRPMAAKGRHREWVLLEPNPQKPIVGCWKTQDSKEKH